MKPITFTTMVLVFVSLLNCGQVYAQATAQISGRVQDATAAVLPGVEITATNTATGIARTTVTNEGGAYVLPNLPIGTYRLEAALPGFRTYAQSGIVLEVNSSPVVNVSLEVGKVEETIEVQANANLVETRKSGIGEVVESPVEWTQCCRSVGIGRSNDAISDAHGQQSRSVRPGKCFCRRGPELGTVLHIGWRGSQQSVRRLLSVDAFS